jgi:indolepyruvate ferredoxin oxidoreductase
VRIAKSPDDIHAVRIAAGEADLVLGCDMVVVNDYWALSKIRADRSTVVLNTYEAMPGGFTMHPDMQFPAKGIVAAVRTALDGREPMQMEATAIANALLGDAIGANLFMLGVAWQQGLVPLSLDALLRAIELNAAAVEMNKTAFAWGRLAAIDPDAVRAAAGLQSATQQLADPAPRATTSANIAELPLDDARLSRNLDEVIARRVTFLTGYQNAAYAKRYSSLVDKVRAAETERVPSSTALSEAVARYAFKLMAYKDEYEVARLYISGDFQRRVAQQFEGDYKLRFHLAPPLFSKKDADGHLIKREYGPWMLTAFGLLAKFRFLRGGMLDIFGSTEERRTERKLIADYFADINALLAGLSSDNVTLAVEIASMPERVRGYGHVKEAHLAEALPKWKALMQRWREPAEARKAA